MTYKYNNNSSLIEYSKRAAILEKDEEFRLIDDWRDNKNPKSLQKILNAYLRLRFVNHAKDHTLEVWMESQGHYQETKGKWREFFRIGACLAKLY